jgi:heme-degrading monooxygenase HmoA
LYVDREIRKPVTFIAVNRFGVAKGFEATFEQVWMSRDSHIDKVPGFVEFHLLKCPEAEDHTFYASHMVWEAELCRPNQRRSSSRSREGTAANGAKRSFA